MASCLKLPFQGFFWPGNWNWSDTVYFGTFQIFFRWNLLQKMIFHYIEIVRISDIVLFLCFLTAVVKCVWSHWKRHASISIVIWNGSSRAAIQMPPPFRSSLSVEQIQERLTKGVDVRACVHQWVLKGLQSQANGLCLGMHVGQRALKSEWQKLQLLSNSYAHGICQCVSFVYRHEYVHFTSFSRCLNCSSQSFTHSDLHCEIKVLLELMAQELKADEVGFSCHAVMIQFNQVWEYAGRGFLIVLSWAAYVTSG